MVCGGEGQRGCGQLDRHEVVGTMRAGMRRGGG